ncbi:MAG: rhomboid family intramembrane serine protease [Clostridiales bacterium]|jgi:rhomboid protease GluP|nr:rhomboid family intramembrane serine protease [Clostridiales bacterium]
MFAQFSFKLYEKAANSEYQLSAANSDEISKATKWVAEKIEMATLVTLHVMDAEKISFQTLLEYDEKTHESYESLLDRVGNIANIYVLAGGEPPDFTGITEYFGQQVYSVFWHINLETGEISLPKGQPKKLFNVHEIVSSAFWDYKTAGEADTVDSFSEISNRVAALRPKAKHSYAILSFTLIGINAVVLALMYYFGYYEDGAAHNSIPVRFGALVAERVIVRHEWYRLFTSMFLHFGIMHFIANAFGILIFGTRLERFLGRRIFLAVYIFSGLAGSVASLLNLYLNAPHTISAGASGAVYGIVGAIFAYTRVTKRSIEFINWYLMLIYIGLGMAMGLATPGIDNVAHLGGLICGILIGGTYARVKKIQ